MSAPIMRVILFTLGTIAFFAQVQALSYIAPPPVVIEPKACDISVEKCVEWFSKEYKVNADVMLNVMMCESSLNPNAIANTPREYSVGISQINLKAHKHITVEQAKDIKFATEFMAKEMSKGNARIWTCYTKLY